MKHHVTTIAAGLAVAVLASGCSNDRPQTSDVAATGPPTSTSAPAPSPTAPFDGDGSAEIWRKADLEAGRATSFHIVMKAFFQKQPVEMDMSFGGGPKAVGTIKVNGHAMKIRRIKKDLWFQAERGFWRDQATERVANTLSGRWVKARQSTPGLKILFDLTNRSYVRKEFVSGLGTNVLYTGVVGGREIDGRQTVGLSARGRDIEGGEYKIVVYIAADESSPLPMQFVALSPKKYRTQRVTYTDWNKKVTVSRPSNAFKIP